MVAVAVVALLAARRLSELEQLVAWAIVPVVTFSLVSDLDEPHYGLAALPLLCVFFARGGYVVRGLSLLCFVLLTTIGDSDVVGIAEWGMAAQLLVLVVVIVQAATHRPIVVGSRHRIASAVAT